MIKKLAVTLALALACFATNSKAALSFGPSGTPVVNFETRPVVADGWSSSFTGSGAGAFTDAAGIDNAVQGVNASAINQPVGSSATIPPSTFGTNRWNSTAHWVQSRPTGVGATLLLATLNNDSGTSQSSIKISYDFIATVVSTATIVEQHGGYRAFYSLSGAAGSWVLIDEFSQSTLDVGTNNIQATISPAGGWPAGSPLYIVWADDNGSDDDSGTTQEGSYAIDNFLATPPGFVGVSITSPTNNATFIEGAPVTIAATATSEGAVTAINFFDGVTLIGSDNVAPFSVTTSTLSVGAHTITAVSQDDLGNSHTSPAITIHINPNQPPVISTVTNNLASTHQLVGTNLTYTAVVSDDGGIARVEFYVDNELRRTDTTSTYTFFWNDIAAGNKDLKVVVFDTSGASTTTNLTLVVTNPPNVDVLLANEQTWKYYDDAPMDGLFDPAWMFPAFDDSSWSNGLAQIGWGDADERTVSRRIVGTPGDPSAITNAVQLFRKHFNVTDKNAYTALDLQVLADDGAVVYINGTEVFRSTNMPSGTINFSTFALGTMPDDGFIFQGTNIAIASSQLVNGDNVVAVEVHQNNITSSDLTFDLMLFGVKPSGATLTISLNGNNAIVRWPGGGMLQFATDLEANTIWSDIDGPYPQVNGQNQVSIPTDVSGPRMFFRVVQ